jgi:hypothetical protein
MWTLKASSSRKGYAFQVPLKMRREMFVVFPWLSTLIKIFLGLCIASRKLVPIGEDSGREFDLRHNSVSGAVDDYAHKAG